MAASSGPKTESSPHLSGMPEGAEAIAQVAARNRRGRVWLALFQSALILAILALIALLFNIINGTAGLVAVQNAIDTEDVTTIVDEWRMLALPNTTASEDDAELAEGVANDPDAIGFFSYHHAATDERLKLIPVENVLLTDESVTSGEYALSRPLYLYVNRRAIQKKQFVANFVHYYLGNVSETAKGSGYFPLPDATISAQIEALTDLNDDAATQAGEGTLHIAGSSTLSPLTQAILAGYGSAGFGGTASIDTLGTSAGIVRLCEDQDVDIALASRAMTRQELEACEDSGVNPIEFQVARDAIAVVVNSANDDLANLDLATAQAIFGSATNWNDVDPAFAAQPIVRYIPGEASGTLLLFADAIFDTPLHELTRDEMILVLKTWLTPGVFRRYNAEEAMNERSEASLLALIEERVIQPRVLGSWDLLESILNRAEIEAQHAEQYPDSELRWWRWLDQSFLTSPQSSVPEQAGVRTAILGSLWVILITMLVAVPIGIGAAIYLEEYAGHSRLSQIIQTNIDNLAGVPSIIYGILGLTIFVRVMEPVTSGTVLGASDPSTANGRTILSAALTLALLVLPVIIINAQEAIRAVPRSLREAGYGLGATKWQVTWTHVLSNALPGIFTGTILAMSRALGETAPLIVVGASTFITTDPSGPFAKFTVLPMQIYQWTSRPQAEFKHIAASASIVLIVLLLLLNGSAIWLRNRYGKKL